MEATKESCRKALDLNPPDPDVHNNLGLVLQSQGSLPEAVAEFRNALRVDPRYAKAYYNLSKLLAGQGDLNGAVENFRQALQVQPGSIGACPCAAGKERRSRRALSGSVETCDGRQEGIGTVSSLLRRSSLCPVHLKIFASSISLMR